MNKYLSSDLLIYPFDQYQRYRLSAEILDRLRKPEEKFEILEIGGLHGLARKFFPQDLILIADLISNGDTLDLLSRAEALPFPDHSFSVVMALDCLEHIPSSHRALALQEMARVSSELVLITAPFQFSLAREIEQIIFDFIKQWLGYEHKYLKEHLQIEAPNLLTSESELIRAGFDTVIFPNGNLERWLLMMLIYYYLEGFPFALKLRQEISAFYNQHYFWQDLTEPAYRHFIVASRNRLRQNPDALKDLMEKRNSDPAPDYEKLRLWAELFRTGELRRAFERIDGLENLLREKEEQIKHLKAYIEKLEDFQKKTKSSFAYWVYKKFFKRD